MLGTATKCRKKRKEKGMQASFCNSQSAVLGARRREKGLLTVYLEYFVDKICISKSYNFKHFSNLKIIRSKIYTDKLL